MRYIVAGIFERAKLFWLAAISAKVAVAIIGFIIPFIPTPPVATAFIILALAAVSSAAFYASDSLKLAAEPMLARLDYEHGLGWPITGEQVDEYYSDFGNFESSGRRVRQDEPYFASTIPTGPDRLKQNILESALFTRDIAKGARNVIFAVFMLIGASFLAALGTGLSRHFTTTGTHSGVEFALDALILLVGLDLLPLGLRYNALVDSATRVRDVLVGIHAEPQVIPAVIEYQIARSSAPLLPTFQFLKRRLPLSKIWSRRSGGSGDSKN